MTPLRLACERRIGHDGVGYRDDQREQRMINIIEELAKVKGIDPNIADRNRYTPLHGAIANQHYETTGCLLALFPTIDPSIKNAKGETALEGTYWRYLLIQWRHRLRTLTERSCRWSG